MFGRASKMKSLKFHSRTVVHIFFAERYLCRFFVIFLVFYFTQIVVFFLAQNTMEFKKSKDVQQFIVQFAHFQ